MTLKPRRVWTFIVAGSWAAAFGLAVYFMTSDTMLRASFAVALNNDHGVSLVRTASAASENPVSGSEAFWLSRSAHGDGLQATKTLAIGDKITLDIGNQRRTLEISKISEYTPEVTEIDTTSSASKFAMVTARDADHPSSSPVRFVIEIEQNPTLYGGGRNGRAL